MLSARSVGRSLVTVTGGDKKRGDYMPTETVGGGSSNGGTGTGPIQGRQDTEVVGRNGIKAASRDRVEY